MFRKALVLLGRPKGPPGLRPGKEYRLTIPYRSEVTMMRLASAKTFNSNIRELFKKPLSHNNIKAIPRDLGELPRNYVVKLLFLHQPVRLLDLWEVCKKQDDVPLDSAKHLRLVLKVAKLQNWVYAEKNQTNNLYYYYIHKSRTHEVQRMIRADEVMRKNNETMEQQRAEEEKQRKETEELENLDTRIESLQSMLASNVASIREYDPEYVESKPYVTEEGAVNFTWHWRDGNSSKQSARENAE